MTFKDCLVRWRLLSVIVFANLVLIAALLFAKIVLQKQVGVWAQNAEFIPLFLNIILSYKIWRETFRHYGHVIEYLFISNILFFLVNFWYFIVYSAPHLSKLIIIFDFIIISWFIITIVFFAKTLWHVIIDTATTKSLQRIIITVLSFLIADIIIFMLFSINIDHSLWVLNLDSIVHLIKFAADLIIFDMAIILLVYSKDRGIFLIASGYITIIASEFMFTSVLSSNTDFLLDYSEMLWYIGMVILLMGLVRIVNHQSYKIKEWFGGIATLRSTLTFWSFFVGFASFIIFFLLIKHFIVNKIIFIFFPTIIMLYSMIIGCVSLLIANIFARPFRQIEANIKAIMIDEVKDQLNDTFAAEEFIFLQKFILEAFNYKDEKTKAVAGEQEKFRKKVGQMMHDIQSPLSSLGTIVTEHSAILPENTRITLRNATEQITDITNNLLAQYRSTTANSEKVEQVLVSLLLLQVLSQKRYEYKNTPVTFDYKFDKAASFEFIEINPTDFKRMLSNLVNNAVDAVRNKDDGAIAIELEMNTQNIVIFIKDNGYGMPEHIQEKFYKGETISEGKADGHGLGLTQVRDVLEKFCGSCDIYVSDGLSTEIVLKFPLIKAPGWIASELKLYQNDTVVILDDDESIHGAWNEKFRPVLERCSSIRIKHFSIGVEAIAYINSFSKEEKKQLFLLTDYELLNQEVNGIDVILKTGLMRSLLVTSHAANFKIQELVMTAGVRSLPKELTAMAAITIIDNMAPASSMVDMVWVEDQLWFAKSLIDSYYSNLTVDLYGNPLEFLENIGKYPSTTRVILDTYYVDSDGEPLVIDGLQIAERLHQLGFSKIILFAGEALATEAIPKYLQVVLKNDNYAKKNLDKI